MRAKILAAAGMAVAAFAATGATPAQAEPAQVPCTPSSGGKVYCNFWVPGDGYSGGSPVVDGPVLLERL